MTLSDGALALLFYKVVCLCGVGQKLKLINRSIRGRLAGIFRRLFPISDISYIIMYVFTCIPNILGSCRPHKSTLTPEGV